MIPFPDGENADMLKKTLGDIPILIAYTENKCIVFKQKELEEFVKTKNPDVFTTLYISEPVNFKNERPITLNNISNKEEIKKIIIDTSPCYCCGCLHLVFHDNNNTLHRCTGIKLIGTEFMRCKYVDGKDCKPDGNCGGKDYFTRSKHSEGIR